MTTVPEPLPERLYKYTNINKYSLKMLTDTELFYRCPLEFNDPFDCRSYGYCKGTHRERRLFSEEWAAKNFKHLSKSEQRRRANWMLTHFDSASESHDLVDPIRLSQEALELFGLTCFSERPLDILMWSHYATQHRGICIEFAPRVFATSREMKQVRYSDDYPEYNLLAMGPDLGDVVLLTKAKHWEYEAEWRMFGPVGKALQFPPESITGVIIGCRTTKENAMAVINAAQKHPTPIQVYIAQQNARRYQLDLIRVTDAWSALP